MQFQVTERITTNVSITDVGSAMLASFRSISASAVPVDGILRVNSIHASFGSINRTDVTDIMIRPVEDGYLLIADVKYRPSFAFWVILILTLFTWVFWLIPIIFYLAQQGTVERGVKDGFLNVKNRLSIAPATQKNISQGNTLIADLERLGNLLQQGLLTQDEFDSQKLKLLGSESQGTATNATTTVSTNRAEQSSNGATARAPQWYYQVMGEEVGPLAGNALKSLADNGTIERDTPVRRGTSQWVLADSVKGLFSN